MYLHRFKNLPEKDLNLENNAYNNINTNFTNKFMEDNTLAGGEDKDFFSPKSLQDVVSKPQPLPHAMSNLNDLNNLDDVASEEGGESYNEICDPPTRRHEEFEKHCAPVRPSEIFPTEQPVQKSSIILPNDANMECNSDNANPISSSCTESTSQSRSRGSQSTITWQLNHKVLSWWLNFILSLLLILSSSAKMDNRTAENSNFGHISLSPQSFCEMNMKNFSKFMSFTRQLVLQDEAPENQSQHLLSSMEVNITSGLVNLLDRYQIFYFSGGLLVILILYFKYWHVDEEEREPERVAIDGEDFAPLLLNNYIPMEQEVYSDSTSSLSQVEHPSIFQTSSGYYRTSSDYDTNFAPSHPVDVSQQNVLVFPSDHHPILVEPMNRDGSNMATAMPTLICSPLNMDIKSTVHGHVQEHMQGYYGEVVSELETENMLHSSLSKENVEDVKRRTIHSQEKAVGSTQKLASNDNIFPTALHQRRSLHTPRRVTRAGHNSTSAVFVASKVQLDVSKYTFCFPTSPEPLPLAADKDMPNALSLSLCLGYVCGASAYLDENMILKSFNGNVEPDTVRDPPEIFPPSADFYSTTSIIQKESGVVAQQLLNDNTVTSPSVIQPEQSYVHAFVSQLGEV